MAKGPYASAGWRKLSLYVRARDGECRLRLPGCTGRADCADHIVTVESGGALLDPLNVRASCFHCNAVRSNQTRGKTVPALGPSRDW